METIDTTKAHLQSFLDGGPLTLDAIQEDGEPINALNSCSFFREHVEEQDTAFRSALEDLSSQDWVSKATTNLKSKGDTTILEGIRPGSNDSYRSLSEEFLRDLVFCFPSDNNTIITTTTSKCYATLVACCVVEDRLYRYTSSSECCIIATARWASFGVVVE